MNGSICKLSFLLLPLLITACAGGGGGGGGSSAGGVTVTPFTSWSAIQPNSTVQATGGSVIASASSGVTHSISGGSFISTYDSVGLTSFTLGASDGSSATFNKNSGSTFTYAGDTVIALNNTNSNVAVLVDPLIAGWNYQSYGVWVNQSPASVAAVSVGSATAPSSIPLTSSAVFSGGAGGIYYDSASNKSYATAANMSANVNFSTRNISFATNSTAKSDLSTGVTSTATNLNLSGTLSYASGVNNISGSISSANGMTGNAKGQFFGPTANEIGGTYLVNSGSNYMIGGFGGKRP